MIRLTKISELQRSDGFELVQVGDAQIVSRPEATAWARQAVHRHGSLCRTAGDVAIDTMSGRGPVSVLANPIGDGPPWVVRRYWRGGWVRFLQDRFLRLGRPRSFKELETSVRLRELDIATPRVLVAASYPAGLFYRADLVTELVPEASSLADVLLGGGKASSRPWNSEQREQAIARTVDLVRRMVTVGVRHPDFNAKNILVSRNLGGIQISLIDLDRCQLTSPSDSGNVKLLLRRLTRSIRKIARVRSDTVPDHEMRLIQDGALSQ
ncbi:MAG: lipopolysaccharide kinase InaA family protein [Gemmatimonadota bacterium]|nr:lipopolysaccharide kinase InaA family protein [Gemmatimonadota bacterium]